jgi:Domain of unknown function (DUF6484)
VPWDELFSIEPGESVSATAPPSARALPGVIIGEIVGIDEDRQPLVDFVGNTAATPLVARSTAVVGPSDVGREVALLFEGGDPAQPIVLGVVQRPPETAPRTPPEAIGEAARPVEANVDGERVVITAQEEIVLRCGKSSITLTRAGKVLIRGAYLLSRSSGVNRVKGGSVQIN